jgi:hypothetical protein
VDLACVDVEPPLVPLKIILPLIIFAKILAAWPVADEGLLSWQKVCMTRVDVPLEVCLQAEASRTDCALEATDMCSVTMEAVTTN